MRKASKKAAMLRRVPLFSACSGREIEQISRSFEEIGFRKGEVLIEQGEVGREAYIIVSGVVEVSKNGTKVAEAGQNEILGELALLDNGPRTARAVCATECTALVISKRDFNSMLANHPSIASRMLARLATRLRELGKTIYG